MSHKADYTSEFSDGESEADFAIQKSLNKKDELYKKPFTDQKLGLFKAGSGRKHKAALKRTLNDEIDKEERKRQRYHGILAMDAFNRHKKMVNDYLFLYGGKREDFKRSTVNDKTDLDVLRENHKFLWNESDSDDNEDELTWEQRLAKKYWDKLYKEYAITDLSKFRENKIAMRWRVEKEVVSGKGQFICGNKHCEENDGLRSWEVNFGYFENNEKKNALVKLRLCAECSYKLNYSKKHKEVKKSKKHKKKHKKKEKKVISKDNKKEKPKDDSIEDLEKEIWSKPRVVEEEKTREDEFDEYFEDLLL